MLRAPETEPVESFGASCSAEFTLHAGASLESATVMLAAPAANAHGATLRAPYRFTVA